MPKVKTDLNLSGNQLINALAEKQASAPTGVAARFYFDTTLNLFRYHDGTSWLAVGGIAAPEFIGPVTINGTGLGFTTAIVINGFVDATDDGWIQATGGGAPNGSTTTYPWMAMSGDTSTIIIATTNTANKVSTDSGATWSSNAFGFTTGQFGPAISHDGTIMYLGSGGNLMVSTDSGTSWSHPAGGDGADNCAWVACDGTGQKVLVGNSGLYYSSNGASTWSSRVDGVGQVPMISPDGSYMVSASYGSKWYRSTNGTSWTLQTGTYATSTAWYKIRGNNAGRVIAVTETGKLVLSKDGGVTSSDISTSVGFGTHFWVDCDVSESGRLIATAKTSTTYDLTIVSIDDGVTWAQQSPTDTGEQLCCAIKSTATGGIAVVSLSDDYPWILTWVEEVPLDPASIILSSIDGTSGNSFLYVGEGAEYVKVNGLHIGSYTLTLPANATLLGGVYTSDAIVTPSTPTTGSTVSAATGKLDELLYIAPAGTLLALTVELPAAGNSRVGQIVRGFITQIITGLTVTAAGSGTVLGSMPATSSTNSFFAYECVSVSGSGTWVRIV